MIHILGSGYIAQAYARHCIVNAIPYKIVSRKEVPYSNPINLATFLNASRPSLVVNCVGIADPIECEKYKISALYANTTIPGFLGEICESLDIPLIHVSTGDIYSETEPRGWLPKEDDPPNFSFKSVYEHGNFYCGTKALAEELLQNRRNVYICRMKLPFTNVNDGRNTLARFINAKMVVRTYNSMTNLVEFVAATIILWARKAPYGKYNIVNPNPITTDELIDLLISLNYRTAYPELIPFCEYNDGANLKTSRCNLSTKKIEEYFKMSPTLESIESCLKRWVK